MAGYGLWMAPTRSRGRERGGDGEVVDMGDEKKERGRHAGNARASCAAWQSLDIRLLVVSAYEWLWHGKLWVSQVPQPESAGP